MSPRLEYALSTGALALALTVLVCLALDMGARNPFPWALGTTAGVAALLAATWVCGWRWLASATPSARRLAVLVLGTVAVAMALFFPLCVALVAALSPQGDVSDWLHGAGVFGVFALVFGTLPALLTTIPLAWRFLRRHDRAVRA